MSQFKRGDIVRLKSGGPTMTVMYPQGEYGGKFWWGMPPQDAFGVGVIWCDAEGKENKSNIQRDFLELVLHDAVGDMMR